MPDQFGGDPAPNTTADSSTDPQANPSILDKVKLGVAETAKSFMLDMWLARQTQEKVLPILNKVIEGAKEEFADAVANGGGIYAVGYCFGGKYVLLLGSELLDTVAKGQTTKDEEQGMTKVEPQIKAGAIAHGTLITKGDIEGLKAPITMACTENDQLFPDHVRTEGQQYLEEHKIEHQIQVYPGVPHGRHRNLLMDSRHRVILTDFVGFAVLGEYEDAKIQEAQNVKDDPAGLDVCLFCFNGGCNTERQHSKVHYEKTKHPLVVNIQRKRKKTKRDEPPQKMSKLAIAAETESDRYDTTTRVRCLECGLEDVDKTSGNVSGIVDSVLKANTFAKQAEVQAWEQEMVPCEHTLCLEQETARKIESQDLGRCSMCDLKENLWLCLQCGNLGCGRAQFGGSGGNSHGLKHTELTSHAVAVKLGSITPEGTADIYCYACNEERTDPEIAAHLAQWGINIAEREKTEKSLTEMQIEQNLKWEFSMTNEDGKEMQPLFGEGFTGLKNLGNSCYMASILQCLFSIPDFQARYYHPHQPPPDANLPAEDLETQLRKVADGLLSGHYSRPDTDVIASEHSSEIPHQKGLAPSMFKHLIGRGHEEFSTMRQQDAFELLQHLFKLITRSPHGRDSQQDPVQSFRFVTEQRLQCLSCKKVRYTTNEQDNITLSIPAKALLPSKQIPDGTDQKDEYEAVTLQECINVFTSPESVDYTCPSCACKGATKRTLFKTFPQNLVVNARRFDYTENWVPRKIDVPVIIGDEDVDLSQYLSRGKQDGEELLPEETSAAAPTFTPNASALSDLEAMGFPRVRCEKALHATGNSDAQAAMEWLFSHMDDPDIDTPVDLSAGGTRAVPAAVGDLSAENVSMLEMMGIGAPQARKALRETGGDVERAVDWVFSHPDDPGDFESEAPSAESSSQQKVEAGSADLPAKYSLQSIACHKGASIHAGHYVAFIRKQIPATGAAGSTGEEEAWVLYNDEKVVKAAGDANEMIKFAYVYFFRRRDVEERGVR
ncbi:MAG: hypothetical protein Q9191_004369 [Dirinaria sp. TL-2023a]